jgi:hypothetical protein
MVALTSEIVYDLKTLEDIARQIPENHAEHDNLRCGKATICRSFPQGFPMAFRHRKNRFTGGQYMLLLPSENG